MLTLALNLFFTFFYVFAGWLVCRIAISQARIDHTSNLIVEVSWVVALATELVLLIAYIAGAIGDSLLVTRLALGLAGYAGTYCIYLAAQEPPNEESHGKGDIASRGTIDVARHGIVDCANVDLALAVDISNSMRMAYATGHSRLSRLEAVQENVEALAAEFGQFGPDGITVASFASAVRIYERVTAANVSKIVLEWRGNGNSNTREAVEKLINLSLGKRATAGATAKPGCVIIFTDGKPDDYLGLEQVIVDATRKIKHRSELGILFVQVGDDSEAWDYLIELPKRLGTAGAQHSIVAVWKLRDLENLTLKALVETAFNN